MGHVLLIHSDGINALCLTSTMTTASVGSGGSELIYWNAFHTIIGSGIEHSVNLHLLYARFFFWLHTVSVGIWV